MSKRRTHSPEFKARVAMEAISGRKTIQEIALGRKRYTVMHGARGAAAWAWQRIAAAIPLPSLACSTPHLLPEAFGRRNQLSARVSTVTELDEVFDRIDAHDGAAYIEVMIPNEESQPMPESTIDSGYKLNTPPIG